MDTSTFLGLMQRAGEPGVLDEIIQIIREDPNVVDPRFLNDGNVVLISFSEMATRRVFAPTAVTP